MGRSNTEALVAKKRDEALGVLDEADSEAFRDAYGHIWVPALLFQTKKRKKPIHYIPLHRFNRNEVVEIVDVLNADYWHKDYEIIATCMDVSGDEFERHWGAKAKIEEV